LNEIKEKLREYKSTEGVMPHVGESEIDHHPSESLPQVDSENLRLENGEYWDKTDDLRVLCK